MEKIVKGHPLSQSEDIVQENIKTLKSLFPTIVKEGKIDMEELKALLDEEIQTDEEYYRFTWAGKSEARREANKPSTATLRPCKEESKNWDTTRNIFIEGDNLEVLKLLQKSYAGKIKMIYIDPPYNTGKEFVYKDNYTDNLGNYLSITGQTGEDGKKLSTNAESDGRFHSNWLNMMYPRLKMAYNMLTDDGVIFISIDDNEIYNLSKLCNEVLGEANFRGNIIRATGTTTGQDGKKIGSSFDYCLCYSKSSDFNLNGLPLVGKDLNRFNNDDNDSKGKYALLQLRKTGNADRKEDRENMFYGITAPDGSLVYPVGPTDYLSRWRVGKATYEEFLRNDLIIWKQETKNIEEEDNEDEENDFLEEEIDELSINSSTPESFNIDDYKSSWKPYVKYYRSGRTKQVSNLWTDIDGNKKGSIELKLLFNKKKIFNNPKPTDFIKRLMLISTNCEDNILDFFAGSGSTMHALMQINAVDGGKRKFICIQLPEPTGEKSEAFKEGYKTIVEITKSRIRRAGEKIVNEKATELKKLRKSVEGKIMQEDVQKQIDELQLTLNNLDTGFKAFRLDSSNIHAWDGSVENFEQNLYSAQNNIKENRSEEDVLYEILIKYGLDLTVLIEEKKVNGCKVYSIGGGVLFVCLSDNITTHTADAIGKWKEALQPATCRVLFKDNGFKDDIAKTNSIQILRQYGIEEANSI